MDYKYIEQLLERYWNNQTTLEEERILQSFFSQEDVPASLMQYKPLFEYEVEAAEEKLGDDFDARMMHMIERPKTVKLQCMTFRQRLMPLLKAVASVAIILTIVNAVNDAFNDDSLNKASDGSITTSSYVKADNVDDLFNVEDDVHMASAKDTINSNSPLNATMPK
jgi:hypothetical protein